MRRCFFVFIFSSSIILVIAAAGYAVQNNGSAGAQTPAAGNVPALHAGPPAAAPRLGRPKPFADITQNASIVSTAEEISR